MGPRQRVKYQPCGLLLGHAGDRSMQMCTAVQYVVLHVCMHRSLRWRMKAWTTSVPSCSQRAQLQQGSLPSVLEAAVAQVAVVLFSKVVWVVTRCICKWTSSGSHGE